jgi:hypothetical protein
MCKRAIGMLGGGSRATFFVVTGVCEQVGGRLQADRGSHPVQRGN